MNFKKTQHSQDTLEREKDRQLEQKKIAAENNRTHADLATKRHIAATKPKPNSSKK